MRSNLSMNAVASCALTISQAVFLLILQLHVYECVPMSIVCPMYVQVSKEPRGHWILLELLFQAVVSHLIWLLNRLGPL